VLLGGKVGNDWYGRWERKHDGQPDYNHRRDGGFRPRKDVYASMCFQYTMSLFSCISGMLYIRLGHYDALTELRLSGDFPFHQGHKKAVKPNTTADTKIMEDDIDAAAPWKDAGDVDMAGAAGVSESELEAEPTVTVETAWPELQAVGDDDDAPKKLPLVGMIMVRPEMLGPTIVVVVEE